MWNKSQENWTWENKLIDFGGQIKTNTHANILEKNRKLKQKTHEKTNLNKKWEIGDTYCATDQFRY